ncbi:MAG: RnfABCDGE type electron transport complex subunit D [Clostridiales bacterium]|jgi:electron transport complex protein RnfD|nr:RnfABCDGE type electron transport complex subunit D [Clostridiales bacterium]
MEHTLTVTSSPHLHCGMNTRGIMLDVLIALLPAVAASVWLFGWRAAVVEVVCIASCVASEFLSRVVMKRPQSVGDLSAVVTGLLLAFNLPATIPLWQAALGGVAAIVVAKQMFGGIGQNFVNPALIGRIVLMASFPAAMNNWVQPFSGTGADAISSATPLANIAAGGGAGYGLGEMFVGMRPGCLGETCAAALLLGGAYLVARRVISPLIPLTYIGTVFVMTWLLGGDPLTAVLSGGLMLGAIFMATDYTTTPLNKTGKAVFALGCGLLTVLIRHYGSLPEGVSFAIVIMNILSPLIERATRPLPFGQKRRLRRED